VILVALKIERLGNALPSRMRSSALATAVVLGVSPVAILGQPMPASPEYQVNSYSTGHQGVADLDLAEDGTFVLVLGSNGSFGDDPDSSVQVRRLDVSGEPLGAEIQVNQATSGIQRSGRLAKLTSGDFVVVWHSEDSFGTDTGSLSIQARRLDSFGNPAGTQFQVNSYTTGHQDFPAVAARPDGGFVVTWISYGSFGSDIDRGSIQARWFGADMEPLAPETQVNQLTTGKQIHPDIAIGSDGSYLVTWESDTGTGDDRWSIRARSLGDDPGSMGSEFQVNSYTSAYQAGTAVTTSGDAGFVVAWHSYDSPGPDTGSMSILARRFDSSLAPLGPEFQINSDPGGEQVAPVIAARSDGLHLILWSEFGDCAAGPEPWCISGRWFDSDWSPLGSDFQVNSLEVSSQGVAGIQFVPNGDVLVGWSSYGSTGDDTSGLSAQARWLQGLFHDGFDSGDVGRWSSVSTFGSPDQ